MSERVQGRHRRVTFVALPVVGLLALVGACGDGGGGREPTSKVPAAAPGELRRPMSARNADFASADLQRGETLYRSACVACHGADLRGAIGFNLVDGEWVHGRKPAQIAANVKAGFPDKGMTGFETIYTDEEIADVVAFVLSRREGWEEVGYRIWTGPAQGAPFDFEAVYEQEPTSEGQFEESWADFSLPQAEEYVMLAEGRLHVPDGAERAIWINAGGAAQFDVSVDGQAVEARIDLAGAAYPISAGRHDVSVAYTTAGSPAWYPRDLVVLLINADTGAREASLTKAGRAFLANTSYEVLAERTARVVRHPVGNLPPSTISVGLPEGMNYGFNTRTCRIVGVWQGDFLDIGPTIDGRGQAPAFPLGDWVFHAPDGIAPGGAGECDYAGMSLAAGGVPTFNFAVDGVSVSLTSQVPDAGILEFAYRAADGEVVPTPEVGDLDATLSDQDGVRIVAVTGGAR